MMTRLGIQSGARTILVAGLCFTALSAPAAAQFFDSSPIPRPPQIVPSAPAAPSASGLLSPGLSLAPPGADATPAPRGPMLQSLPPAASPGPAQTPDRSRRAAGPGRSRRERTLRPRSAADPWRIALARLCEQAGPERRISPGEGRKGQRRRCSRCRPAITSSMSASGWRTPASRCSCAPTACAKCSKFPPAACASKGAWATSRIPQGQISFDIYQGSQFEPGNKRPLAQSVVTGDVVLLPEGTYHIASNYGDGNSVVRSDIRVQTGKLTDATVTHRAAVIMLKLVNEPGGEALANTAVVGAHPGWRRDQGIDRRVSAGDPGGRRVPRDRPQRR